MNLYFTLLGALHLVSPCQQIAIEAPETMRPPIQEEFITEAYYLRANARYQQYGTWASYQDKDTPQCK